MAVDLAELFLEKLLKGAPQNVTVMVNDVRLANFTEGAFDRILIYAGIQYFTESEIVQLMLQMRRWLRPGGRIVIGDIPDTERRWRFFNSPEREASYFEGLKSEQPLVGTWFDEKWLVKLARYAGFVAADRQSQHRSFPYQHYRFDMVIAG
jgi:cyclopropane fatty-acyl-phospholipid synthase-like methyltransferase